MLLVAAKNSDSDILRHSDSELVLESFFTLLTCFNRLNEDARKLIAELGSTSIQSLGFRDNWVFVGGKGAAVKSNFEKVMTVGSSFL